MLLGNATMSLLSKLMSVKAMRQEISVGMAVKLLQDSSIFSNLIMGVCTICVGKLKKTFPSNLICFKGGGNLEGRVECFDPTTGRVLPICCLPLKGFAVW